MSELCHVCGPEKNEAPTVMCAPCAISSEVRMIPVYAKCYACKGDCHVDMIGSFGLLVVTRCTACDGLGRQWSPGAPAYGCSVTLADREPGEIVTLGNGQRAKILWHQPRKRNKQKPETTFIDLLIDDLFDTPSYNPVAYPSVVGVASVDNPITVVDRESHDREKNVDHSDPMQRRSGALL